MKNNDNKVKEALYAIKKRICIGAIAIFVVSCYELWDNANISHISAILLSVYLSLAISIIGYFVMKSMVIRLIKKDSQKLHK